MIITVSQQSGSGL